MNVTDGSPAELGFEMIGPGHAAVLAKLFERNAARVSDSFDPFPLTATQACTIARAMRDDAYYLARVGDRPVGMSMLRGFDDGYDIPSFGIFIDYDHHGRGIGRRLTEWTIDRARLRNCPAVRLSVYEDNTVARGLYASLGFVETEREYVANIPRPRNKLIMRLDLDAQGG